MRRNNASLVVVLTRTAISEIWTEVIIKLGVIQFFANQFVLQFKEALLGAGFVLGVWIKVEVFLERRYS